MKNKLLSFHIMNLFESFISFLLKFVKNSIAFLRVECAKYIQFLSKIILFWSTSSYIRLVWKIFQQRCQKNLSVSIYSGWWFTVSFIGCVCRTFSTNNQLMNFPWYKFTMRFMPSDHISKNGFQNFNFIIYSDDNSEQLLIYSCNKFSWQI